MRCWALGLVSVALFAVSCTRQTTSVTTLPGDQQRVFRQAAGDTAAYTVVFGDRKAKKEFVHSLESFLSHYAFDTLVRDTVRQYVVLRLAQEDQKKMSQEPGFAFGKIDRGEFSESDLVDQQIEPVMESEPAPAAGGKAVIYTERSFVDEALLPLVSPVHQTDSSYVSPPQPDQAGQSNRSYFDIQQISTRKIRLTIRDDVRNGEGRRLGAFDVVEAWTASLRSHPAEGLALFRHVQGLEAFIRGQEAVVSGIQITDERSISLTLTQDDPAALVRLASPRLMPPSLKCGPYYIGKQMKNRLVLQADAHCVTAKPYLDQAAIVLNGDNNPFVSFSLNQYDVMLLSQSRDLEYARRSLADKAQLLPLASDIYFLSLAGVPATQRAAVARLLGNRESLIGAAKVEGRLVGCIQSTDCEADNGVTLRGDGPFPKQLEPLVIIYRSDDLVSSRIAEKIVADFASRNVRSVMKGLAAAEYEKTLLARDFAIAVGWVSEAVRRSESERLRLATIWFNDLADEMSRVQSGLEIPLFSVSRFALAKKHIALYKERLSGIHVKQP